ncbi:MAG: methane monooxygenase/ammonia monooxygenase subunit B [Gammaproteobacteria bacterium]|nr:methane monooxygenase/ammonia monooxygenase subunit B [Gammaproteobacteria bacterium]
MSFKNKIWQMPLMVLCLTMFQLYSDVVMAHGERAQQAGIRMRTMYWWDIEVHPRKAKIGETVVVTGKFMPSTFWPEHLASSEEASFMNIGVPGPAFLRMHSEVNGTPMVRSTRFYRGKEYHFKVTMQARQGGRYHVHPVVSVQDAGPIIASGVWIEVEGERPDDFKNEVTTLMGDTIDLETYGMKEIIWFNTFWFIVGFAWLGYWFIRKDPVILPRYAFLQEHEEDAGKLISMTDMVVSALFFGFTMVAITAGYLWASDRFPNTTPLQTGKVVTNEIAPQVDVVDVVMSNAVYHIPGRAFNFDLTITNKGDSPLRVGEFATAAIRFVNADVQTVTPIDETDPVSPAGLIVTGGAIPPGETKTVRVSANDALWEKYRLTSLIYDPDSRFGGMIFLFDEEGNRYYAEMGGVMIPDFKNVD